MIKGKQIRMAVRKAVNPEVKSKWFTPNLIDLTYDVRNVQHLLHALREENMKYDEAKIIDDWYLRVTQLQEEIHVYCEECDKKRDADKRKQRAKARKGEK